MIAYDLATPTPDQEDIPTRRLTVLPAAETPQETLARHGLELRAPSREAMAVLQRYGLVACLPELPADDEQAAEPERYPTIPEAFPELELPEPVPSRTRPEGMRHPVPQTVSYPRKPRGLLGLLGRFGITVELYMSRFRRWRDTGGERCMRASWRWA